MRRISVTPARGHEIFGWPQQEFDAPGVQHVLAQALDTFGGWCLRVDGQRAALIGFVLADDDVQSCDGFMIVDLPKLRQIPAVRVLRTVRAIADLVPTIHGRTYARVLVSQSHDRAWRFIKACGFSQTGHHVKLPGHPVLFELNRRASHV